MPKINVYLPDELAEAVKEGGVPVRAHRDVRDEALVVACERLQRLLRHARPEVARNLAAARVEHAGLERLEVGLLCVCCVCPLRFGECEIAESIDRFN